MVTGQRQHPQKDCFPDSVALGGGAYAVAPPAARTALSIFAAGFAFSIDQQLLDLRLQLGKIFFYGAPKHIQIYVEVCIILLRMARISFQGKHGWAATNSGSCFQILFAASPMISI